MQEKTKLSHASPKLTGLVLAAGRGKRFDPNGLSNKLSACLPDGRPVLQASVEALVPWVDEIVLVVGPHSDLDGLFQTIRAPGCHLRLLVCPDADQGMSETVKCGLSGTSPSLGWLMALGDMPGIGAATYEAVRDGLEAGAMAVRPFYQGQPGHPVGVSITLRQEMMAAHGEQGLARVLKTPATALEKLISQDPGCVADIDTPAQLSSFPCR
jgi:molybdenum cofactor cytidylyltransferase